MFFWRIYSSKYCKENSLYNLKYNYTMPEILKLWSLVEMQEAVEEAQYLDAENTKPK